MRNESGEDLNFDHGKFLAVDAKEVRNGQPACIWRQMGCKLAEAMKGSSMEVYYSLLCEVVRIAQADMAVLEAQPGFRATKQPEPPRPLSDPELQIPKLQIPEKVADQRIKGSGV